MNSEPSTPILASDPAGDRVVVLPAKRGDEGAFGILCRRHWPNVFACAALHASPRQVILAAILLLPLLVLVAQQKSSLIDGPQGQASVIQMQGKNYVEVDEVARITGGSLHFAASQIILTFPGHGGPGMVANTYLEGTYAELYPNIQQNEEGMRRLFKQFSFPRRHSKPRRS